MEEGSRVREDQVLLRLEDTEIRNGYAQAQIAVDQARVALQQAEVKAQQSKANYERAVSLFEQKLISQQEFDQMVLANRTDDLALEATKEQGRASLARLEAARIQLAYTEIRSSIDGVVTQRLVYVGDRVNPNQPVFTVEDLSVLWARIFIPERDLPQIKVGQEAAIRADALPGKEFEAVVKMINPTVDPASGTVKVTLEVRSRESFLRPGMFGNLFIATQTHPDAVVIPKKAILRERDENRVFVVKSDGAVEKRDVVLGFSDEDRVEILSGVNEGEAVVTVGYEGLSDGYPVNVVAWEGSRAGATTAAGGGALPPARAPEQVANSEVRQPRRGGGFDRERMRQFRERLLGNPEIRKEYEARLEKDPSLATDPEKQRAFFREMTQRLGGSTDQQ